MEKDKVSLNNTYEGAEHIDLEIWLITLCLS